MPAFLSEGNVETPKKNGIAERFLLTDQLNDVMVRTLRPGFHGRITASLDAKDGQAISTEITVTTKTLARKEYDHN